MSTAEKLNDATEATEQETPLWDAYEAKKAAGKWVSGAEYMAAYEEQQDVFKKQQAAKTALKKAAKTAFKKQQAAKPEVSDEEKAQLETELNELLSKVKTTGDAKWDDELHYGWADDATAKRLAEIQAHGQGGNTLAWDPTASGGARGESGAWRTWDGNRWKLDTNNKEGRTYGKTLAHISRRELETWENFLKTAKKNREMSKEDLDFIKGKVSNWNSYSRKVGNTLGINSGLMLLQSEPGMTPNVEWDNNPNLLATPNGTIELSSDFSGEPEIRDANRADWLTRSTAVGLTQNQYHDGPVATQFEKMLEQALPNPDVRRYFQKVMGYLLLGNNSKRKFIVLHGGSSSGKTTIMQIIAGVLGEYASDFSLSLFRASKDEKARPDIIRAMNARMIYASETSQQWELDADQVKRMTGGDTVSARLNYGNDFASRIPAFTPVLATNQAPRITGADEAVWRRLIVFWFPNKIEAHREDEQLAARIIRDEGPAVLAWLLDGYRAYSEGTWIVSNNGQWITNKDGEEIYLEDEHYVEPGLNDMPADVINATMRFRGQLSSSDEYINEGPVTRDTGNPDVHEKTAALYAHYRQWCIDAGIDTKKIDTKTLFGAALDRNGHPDTYVGPKEKRDRARAGIQIDHLADEPAHAPE